MKYYWPRLLVFDRNCVEIGENIEITIRIDCMTVYNMLNVKSIVKTSFNY